MSPIAFIKSARFDLQCMFFYENSLWFWIASLGCRGNHGRIRITSRIRTKIEIASVSKSIPQIELISENSRRQKVSLTVPLKCWYAARVKYLFIFFFVCFSESAVHFRNFLLCCPSQRSARSQVPSVFVHLLVVLLLTHSRKYSLVNCCMYNTVHLRCRGQAAEGPAGGGHVLETPVQHPPHPGAAAGGSTLYTHGGGDATLNVYIGI